MEEAHRLLGVAQAVRQVADVYGHDQLAETVHVVIEDYLAAYPDTDPVLAADQAQVTVELLCEAFEESE